MAPEKDPPNRKTPTDFNMTKSDSAPETEASAAAGADNLPHQEITMENEMARLCKRLSIPTKDFPKQIDSWLKDLNAYIDAHGRLLYSIISDYVFDLDPDASTRFETNAYALLEYELRTFEAISSPTEKDRKQRQIVLKFYDHVNLAIKQHRMFSNQQADVDAVVDRKLESALTKTTRELTNQLVGLVAIFTALSFIVFGSISSLQNILETLSKKPNVVLPTLIVAVAWAFCILNLLFAFMYFILRIIKEDSHRVDRRNVVQKYPVVFLTNYILFSTLLLLLGSWAAINTGVGSKFYNLALLHGSFTFVFVLGIIICIIITTGTILLQVYNLPVRRYPLPQNRHRRRTP